MQCPCIMAFRKRLSKRGYREISIKRVKDSSDIYVVTAVEPLAHQQITVNMSIGRMWSDFRF